MGISRVGIVGGGQMGGGIAEVCAKAGVDVIVAEVSQDLADRSKAGITRSLDKAVERGKLDAAGRDAAIIMAEQSRRVTPPCRIGPIKIE